MANVTDDKRISHQVDVADALDLFLPEITRRPQLFFTFRAIAGVPQDLLVQSAHRALAYRN